MSGEGMIIRQAELFATAGSPAQYPTGGRPEFALVGRSNVGKSSLINTFLNRNNLARTSGTPGKTRTLNFYRINEDWFFTDLPGYGYAKAAKTERAKWGKAIDEYLANRRELAGIIQLVDLRHPPMESDVTMIEWLLHYAYPVLVVGTKADKVPRGRWAGMIRQIRRGLTLPEDTRVIVHSSKTGMGKEELGTWLAERISDYDGP